MIYITGDTHGDFRRVANFCDTVQSIKDDIFIILGDAGINYFDSPQDDILKQQLSELPITLFCIHGNHEQRPENIDTYKETDWNGGKVYMEYAFPSLLFAKDGEVYSLGGKQCIAIGGAYSVDKKIRLANNWGWWPDEQPSEDIKQRVEKRIKKENDAVDIVLSHTCPLKYVPTEVFLSEIDQNSVDNSTEKWLDGIEDTLSYNHWYCGHYHTNKTVDKITFLFEGFLEFR